VTSDSHVNARLLTPVITSVSGGAQEDEKVSDMLRQQFFPRVDDVSRGCEIESCYFDGLKQADFNGRFNYIVI
jgi:hypothetical protein